MGYKEIMQGVSKADAVSFITNLKERWSGDPRTFTSSVYLALYYATGKYADGLTGGTANAIVTRMERKSGLQF